MTTTLHQAAIRPTEVHDSLRKHILADGLPLVMDLERSHGSWLYDARGERELLDLFTCFSTCPLGYNHPGLRTPEFLDRILPAALNKPSNSDLYTREMAGFVEAFARTVPDELAERMFFIDGGALAVENALKTAFDWKVLKNRAAGRPDGGTQILHFRHAFHGRSGYTMSITNTDPRKTAGFPKFDWPRIPNPTLRFPVTPEVIDEVERGEDEAAAAIERAVRENPGEIAGLIVEPIQGEGGDKHFRGEFLRRLRDLADEHEFLLIFDEVQTGFGTTGSWWCFEHFDVLPDVFAFGKKTQVCGICAGPRVDEVDSVFQVSSRINSTWGGSLVDMVRCHRYIEIIEAEGLIDNAARVGEVLLAGVQRFATEFAPRVTNPRGRGLFIAFDLTDGAVRDRTLKSMMQAGVLGLASGERSIRFRPALSLSREEAAEALRRVESVLSSTTE